VYFFQEVNSMAHRWLFAGSVRSNQQVFDMAETTRGQGDGVTGSAW
jgi:hypothetical protein